MNYYVHPESDSVVIAAHHPGELCEEVGPVGEGGPSREDFARCYQAETGKPPPEVWLAAAEETAKAFQRPSVARTPGMTGSAENDWLDDAHLENGNYFNRCVHCGADFIGHKHRVSCRCCNATRPKPDYAAYRPFDGKAQWVIRNHLGHDMGNVTCSADVAPLAAYAAQVDTTTEKLTSAGYTAEQVVLIGSWHPPKHTSETFLGNMLKDDRLPEPLRGVDGFRTAVPAYDLYGQEIPDHVALFGTGAAAGAFNRYMSAEVSRIKQGLR